MCLIYSKKKYLFLFWTAKSRPNPFQHSLLFWIKIKTIETEAVHVACLMVLVTNVRLTKKKKQPTHIYQQEAIATAAAATVLTTFCNNNKTENEFGIVPWTQFSIQLTELNMCDRNGILHICVCSVCSLVLAVLCVCVFHQCLAIRGISNGNVYIYEWANLKRLCVFVFVYVDKRT